MTGVTFRVLGDPKPQGSKSAFTARNGRAHMKEAGGLEFAAWRNAVSEAAADQRDHLGRPLDGPLRLTLSFRFVMPMSRPKRDRDCGTIYKTTAPDTSKLTRLVEDSLQAAGLITDDARIAVSHGEKYEVWQSWTGVEIRVEELTPKGRR